MKMTFMRRIGGNLVGRLKTGVGHFGHTELLMEGLGGVDILKNFAMVRTAKVAISNREGRRSRRGRREGRGGRG